MNVSKLSVDPEEKIAEELAHKATHGIGETGVALAKGTSISTSALFEILLPRSLTMTIISPSPMDILLGVV